MLAISAPVIPFEFLTREYLPNLLWRVFWTMKLNTITRIIINQMFVSLKLKLLYNYTFNAARHGCQYLVRNRVKD